MLACQLAHLRGCLGYRLVCNREEGLKLSTVFELFPFSQ